VAAGAGSVDGDGASGANSARSAGSPTMLKARKGTSTIGSPRSRSGIAARASRPRRSNATATVSVGAVALNVPLTINR
jgi:hypothetical protein